MTAQSMWVIQDIRNKKKGVVEKVCREKGGSITLLVVLLVVGSNAFGARVADVPLLDRQDCMHVLEAMISKIPQDSSMVVAVVDLFEKYSIKSGQLEDNVFRTMIQSAVEEPYGGFVKRAGSPLSPQFEYLGSIELGGSLVEFAFLERRQFRFLVWTFQFYWTGKEWRASGLYLGQPAEMLIECLRTIAKVEEYVSDAERIDGPLLNKQDCMSVLEAAISKIPQDSSAVVFSDLFKRYTIRPKEAEKLASSEKENIRKADAMLMKEIGTLLIPGFECLGRVDLGTCVTEFVFLEKRRFGFVTWIFTFYHTGKEWRISSYDFGNDKTIRRMKFLGMAIGNKKTATPQRQHDVK